MTKPIIITELPFAFWVADRQDNPALYIVDPDKRYNQRLNFYIENTASQTLFFGPTQLEAKPPSAEHCHFELRFRRGVLADASLGTSTYKGLEKKSIELLLTGKYQKRAYDIGSWVISEPDDHGGEKPYVSFYLARAEKGSGGRFLPGERLRLVLTNISASPEEGSAETRIELVPRNIFYAPPLQEGSAPVVEPREQNVLVINHTGKEHIPLHLAFIGNYTVRNDGQAQGEGHLLRLRITNTSRHDTISFNEKSRVLFAFDYADGDQDEELGTSGNVEKIGFYLKKAYNKQADQDWKQLGSDPEKIKTWLENYCQAFEAPTPGQQNPIWRLDEDQGLHELQLEPHEHWDVILDTSDFITHSPAGLTPLHITYEDIPGYWDGKLHTAVEKTPLMVRKGAGIHGHISKETVEMDSGNRTLYLMGNDRDGSANDHARLHVMGRTFVDGRFVATGETELRNTLIVTEEATFRAKASINADASITGALNAGSLSVNGDSEAKSNLKVGSNETHQLEVRHIEGRKFNAGEAKDLYLNYYSGKDVFIGHKDRPSSLHVRGRVQDKTGDVMPVGSIIAFGGQKIPEGWLECNGQEIPDGSKYNKLKEVLGEIVLQSFKEATGKTTEIRKGYVVPDLRSRFIVGQGEGEGKDGGDYDLGEFYMHEIGGEIEHKLTKKEMPSHSHSYRDSVYFEDYKPPDSGTFKWEDIGDNKHGSGDTDDDNQYIWYRNRTTGSSGSDQPHNNLPPYYALRYIIKY
jgi:microcystin-dependent protein